MQYSKLQIGCMIIVLYVTCNYIREKRSYQIQDKNRVFGWLLGIAIYGIAMDGITAYTVNHLEQVPAPLNRFLHLQFLLAIDTFVFVMYLYIRKITGGLPKRKKTWMLLLTPLILNLGIVIIGISELHYDKGRVTNYSMGLSAYTCFVMFAVYMFAAIGLLLLYWRNIGRHKEITILTCLGAAFLVTFYQMFQPEALLTALVPTIVITGIYLNMENPLLTELKKHNDEMVMGFATLVENRDNSTGGHIKRTTAYVRTLAEELRDRGYYKKQLTKAYIETLAMAAPMHDVGKIAIPDAILQKPGKLTEEEYEIMKTHAAHGGEIVLELFGHTGDEEYEKMAYEVARYHHEKWNGKGYPDGIAGEKIPLSARIMAVSDVFDAVSAKRCYRDALPLEECFQIIEEGKGQDFDPVIAEVFLEIRDQIRKIYEQQVNLR